MNELIKMDELQTLGSVFVKSGFFADSRDASQAIVKILAGREIGFGPIASMTGIHIIQGKPSFSANLIAAKIKASGKYDYRVREIDDNHCTIEFFEIIEGKRESIGVSNFTIADAKRAGSKNLDKYPRNMLFSRAITNGARWYCPDIFNGGVYTPDELGAQIETNENGELIKVIEPAQPAITLETLIDKYGIERTLSAQNDHPGLTPAQLAALLGDS